MSKTPEDQFLEEYDVYFVEHPLTHHARAKLIGMLKAFREKITPITIREAQQKPQKVVTIWKTVNPFPVGKGGHIRKLTPNEIVKIICEYFDIPQDILTGKSQKREIVYARDFCMYFLYRYTQYSLKRIGIYLNGRDHTTITHGIQVIKDKITIEEDSARDYNQLLNIFSYGSDTKQDKKNSSAIPVRQIQGPGNRAV